MTFPNRPLFLPDGSVRALIALAVIGAYIGGLLQEKEIVTLILGFYFGQKVGA